jgi:hypothetical protein
MFKRKRTFANKHRMNDQTVKYHCPQCRRRITDGIHANETLEMQEIFRLKPGDLTICDCGVTLEVSENLVLKVARIKRVRDFEELAKAAPSVTDVRLIAQYLYKYRKMPNLPRRT